MKGLIILIIALFLIMKLAAFSLKVIFLVGPAYLIYTFVKKKLN